MSEDLKFFDPWAEIERGQNRLPHWQQPGRTYFATFHLADAVPRDLLDRWRDERKAWLAHHPEPWSAQVEAEYNARFSGAMERWLDAGHGACMLRAPENAAVVAEALGFFDGKRYVQHAWVVMPNHIHALFSLHADWAVERIVQAWKSVSSRKLGGGKIWQKDYFDRLVRDQGHFTNCVRYIRRNPDKARLREGEYLRYESEMARGIE